MGNDSHNNFFSKIIVKIFGLDTISQCVATAAPPMNFPEKGKFIGPTEQNSHMTYKNIMINSQ